jgi:phosphatidylinositol glycan class S
MSSSHSSLQTLTKWQVLEALQRGDYTEAFSHSRDSLVASERAFFDPTIVSMLYFPDEHKYAVYLPFFGPLVLPLILSIVRLVKSRKKIQSSQT